ncbi:MAG: LysE family translocator [Halioglobus sp.]
MLSTEFLMTSLVVVLIPGTGVIYTLSVGLLQGKRASFFAALGCTFGIVPSLLACIFGLAVIMHTSALAFQVIKYVGVVYLLYLAWAMWRDSAPINLDGTQGPIDALAIALRGFLINILNPKLTLFFLAFLPQFIPADAAAPLLNMLALGGVFMLMTLLVFILYGCLADAFRGRVVESPAAARVIQRTFAASFAALAAKLALTDR